MAEDAEENPVEIELESLEAIYINELSYKRKEDGSLDHIELLLHPATRGNKDEQFVCMTLVFTPSAKYPDEIPAIAIKNPRGVGEEEIASLVEDMITKAHECVGEVMMFTLIEMAKDSLTEGNIPHCPCVVCLEHFLEHDLFHRTACYHYFHNKCLGRYLEHCRKQIEEQKEKEIEMRHRELPEEYKMEIIGCPLCRAPLGDDSLAFTIDGSEGDQQEEVEEPKFEVLPDLKEQQAKMAELFARQKAKGGIIDLEQEKNKYLVNAEESRPVPSISPVQPSSPAKQEGSIGRDFGNSKAHQTKYNNNDLRGGKTERNVGSSGRGRGRHNHQRENNDHRHNHHRNDDRHNHHRNDDRHNYHREKYDYRPNHHREKYVNRPNHHREKNDDHHNHHIENNDDRSTHHKEKYADRDNHHREKYDAGDNHHKEKYADRDNHHKEKYADRSTHHKERYDDRDNHHREKYDDRDNHHREKYDDRDNYHRPARSHNHGHHNHEARRGSGRGRVSRGGSANRGSRCDDKEAMDARPALHEAKPGQDDAPTLKQETGAKALDTEQVRQQNHSIHDVRISSMQSSECSGVADDVVERIGPDSRLQERKGSPSSSGRQRASGGNRGERRGFSGRARGRGGRYNGGKNNFHEGGTEHVETERGIDKEEIETRTLLGGFAEERVASETDQDKGQRANKRGRGRGRFRDFDRAYFEGEAPASGDPNNCDRPSNSKVWRDPVTRGRGGGCRERHKQSYHRDNEYDDSGDGNSRYPKGPARSGQWKRGSAGQRSQTAGSSNHHHSEESHKGEGQPHSNNLQKFDAAPNPDINIKIQQELEMNRKWRKLNFGYNTSEAEHKGNVGLNVIGDDDDDDRHNCEEQGAKKLVDESTSSNTGLFIPSTTDNNLNMYYVGYDEEEEEEDWEKESFPYAFERSYIRTEDLAEYDKFRRKDYEFYQKKVQDRADRERLLREEDRRMRREQAEMKRKLENSAEPKPATKSVLELFQEKQEAKRKEAERLKQEQQRQESATEKTRTESFCDEAFNSDDHTASSSTSKTGSDSCLSSSSQGYRSQSSTEELLQDDVCDKTMSAKSKSESSTKDKTGACGPASNDIKWVGVKQKSFPEPGDLTRDEAECIRPGLDDPCIDAWERREELKRNGRERGKKNRRKAEKCSVADVGVPDIENKKINYLLMPSTDTEIRENGIDDTAVETLISSTPSNELTQATNKKTLKPKALTKAPPLDLSKRNKRKPPSAPPAGKSCSGVPELTKKELAQLKALYIDEETTEHVSKPELHEMEEPKWTCAEVDSNHIAVKDKQLTVEAQNPHSVMNAPVVDSAISSHSKACSNHRQRAGLQEENRVSRPLNKPFKKAPPLNLKQLSNSKKKKSHEADPPSATTSQGETLPSKTGQNNMSKVMKYLGIQLDDDS